MIASTQGADDMSNQTLLTKAQQAEFLSTNWQLATLTHKWSVRGMGNSKILDNKGSVLGKAGGCGYDRYGAALGESIMALFPAEVLKLAKRVCKGKRGDVRKGSSEFYGLFLYKDGRAALDGGCGEQCMTAVLNKIGFSLDYVAKNERSNSGEVFYTLTPLSSQDRRFIK